MPIFHPRWWLLLFAQHFIYYHFPVVNAMRALYQIDFGPCVISLNLLNIASQQMLHVLSEHIAG